MANIITIRLETDNNATIKVVRINGKTIKMLSFLRSAYDILKNNYNSDTQRYSDYSIAQPGVYVLIGEDSKSIYIGQSDNVLGRLYQHFSDKDKTENWVNTLIFLADGTCSLNISQIKYIEANLIKLSKDAAKVVLEDNHILNVKNIQMAAEPNINIDDKIVAENFLLDILEVAKALGINYFEVKKIDEKAVVSKEIVKYYFRTKTYDSTMIIVGENYIVEKGSKIVKVHSSACKEYIKTRRDLLLANGQLEESSEWYVLKFDIAFDSASTAAGIVCGRSSNGRVEWKTKEGKTLKDLGM